MARIILLATLWIVGAVVAFQLRVLGDQYRWAIAAIVVSGTIAIWMRTIRRPHRDPIFGFFIPNYWVIYFVLAVIIAALSLGYLPRSVMLALQVINLAAAVLIHNFIERVAGKVDNENVARTAERRTMKDLQAAAARLKSEAAFWPVAEHKPEIDALLRNVEETVRFAPSRVPPSAEPIVADTLVVVETTMKRLRDASGQPAQWYASEVRECAKFVTSKLGLLQSLMSAGRA